MRLELAEHESVDEAVIDAVLDPVILLVPVDEDVLERDGVAVPDDVGVAVEDALLVGDAAGVAVDVLEGVAVGDAGGITVASADSCESTADELMQRESATPATNPEFTSAAAKAAVAFPPPSTAETPSAYAACDDAICAVLPDPAGAMRMMKLTPVSFPPELEHCSERAALLTASTASSRAEPVA